jgi:Fe-S-cluster containining protein
VSDADSVSDALLALHAGVDSAAAEVGAFHGARLRCGRGCSGCCVDALTVFEIEADRIRAAHAELLSEGTPHAPGACAFLDGEGACRIYADRPYVCRTQGLPLRWLEETREGVTQEWRDICPENLEGAPLAELPEEACWLIGPVEGRLAALQSGRGDGRPRRVALRDLFRRRR